MELKAAIEARATVRKYTEGNVPEEDLREMVRLAGRAPSMNNAQPWRYIAVLERALCGRIADAVRGKLEQLLPEPADEVQKSAATRLFAYVEQFGAAPALIVAATRRYPGFLDAALMRAGVAPGVASSVRGHPDSLSLGASIQNLLLAATDLGYGSCWLTAPFVAAPEIERMLDITEPWRLGAVVAIGRAAGTTEQSPKKTLEEIFELRV
jgi:nitroreductase